MSLAKNFKYLPMLMITKGGLKKGKNGGLRIYVMGTKLKNLLMRFSKSNPL